jgi:CubicO group peptidase (beta-lactamase class C family)
MLLGRALEIAASDPLDRLMRRRLAGTIGMNDTAYLPLAGLSECETGRLVTTGYSEARRKEKVGDVDDENAASMGGVAGHAGIFSTSYDLFLFSAVLRARRGRRICHANALG